MIKIFFGQVKVLIWFEHITVRREVADGPSCSHLVKSLLLLLLCSASYFQDEVRNVRNNFLLLIHNFDQVSEILQHLQNTGDKGSLVLCVCKTYSGHWYFPQIILKQILKLCNWPGPGEWPCEIPLTLLGHFNKRSAHARNSKLLFKGNILIWKQT